jgi:hypothetical protein
MNGEQIIIKHYSLRNNHCSFRKKIIPQEKIIVPCAQNIDLRGI